MKLYTRSGDDGTTGLLFGGRASKAGPRTEAYGSHRHGHIGHGDGAGAVVRRAGQGHPAAVPARHVHRGDRVAVDPDHYDLLIENFSPVTEGMVERLERWIDALDDEVDLPPRFIVPDGAAPNDNVLRYVNRLSDLLFILARYEDRDLPFEITTGEMRRDAE
ncbi:hypothetical protein GBAR_LOCUS14085 [Geodia barretti]|uniref:Cobalamin adenosyltransferase-like domain-containing protein n=1 Tax=Geodia barretti TaxID=519541 RepID=A0AA35WRQ4_GEOBA|nr:hypothetical protein GBAR_LOCUS14085 [Geodia barretti]